MNLSTPPSDADSWYENDILGMAVLVFRRTGSKYNQILESALGIGHMLSAGDMKEARRIGTQLQAEMYKIQQGTYPQPPDEGQLKTMMLSDLYPETIRNHIATEALGFPSLEEYKTFITTRIRGIERVR